MMTLKQLSHGLESIPASVSWYLADIGEAKGKQELFTKQSPQRLKVLREHALIESAVSSNRIEGVEIDRKRIGTVVFGRQLLHDRSEEEVRGYREALDLIHGQGQKLPVSEKLIKKLHRLKGAYKEFEERIGAVKSLQGRENGHDCPGNRCYGGCVQRG